jgi:hypothetical protein
MAAEMALLYVGPGIGLALLGPFFTLALLVGIALLTLFAAPLRRAGKRVLARFRKPDP